MLLELLKSHFLRKARQRFLLNFFLLLPSLIKVSANFHQLKFAFTPAIAIKNCPLNKSFYSVLLLVSLDIVSISHKFVSYLFSKSSDVAPTRNFSVASNSFEIKIYIYLGTLYKIICLSVPIFRNIFLHNSCTLYS